MPGQDGLNGIGKQEIAWRLLMQKGVKKTIAKDHPNSTLDVAETKLKMTGAPRWRGDISITI